MALVWRCSCGEEWPEDGRGEGCSLAWGHQMATYRDGTRSQHVPQGLIDTDTGEVLQKSFSPVTAQRNGLIEKRADSIYEQRERRKEGYVEDEEDDGEGGDDEAGDEAGDEENEDEESSDSNSKKGRPSSSGGGNSSGGGAKKGRPPAKKRAGPVIGKVPIIQVTIPAELYFLYVLTQSRYEGFDDTAESFIEWLAYCVFKLHTLYPEVFGLQEFLLDAVNARGIKIGSEE